MNVCRYESGISCTGQGTRPLTLCDTCRGAVDLDPHNHAPRITEPKTTKEERPMPKPEKSPVGDCPTCNRKSVPLASSKHHPQERVCATCVARFTYRAKAEALKAGKAPVAAKVPSAPPSKGKDEKTQQRAKDDGRTYSERDLSVAPAHPGLTLRFEVRIRAGMTPLEIMELMRAVPTDAVVA